MKNLLLVTLLSLVVLTSYSQGFQAKTYMERTHVSPKLGTAIGFQFRDQIEVGGFFQRATVMDQPESGRPLKSENEFYGAYFAYPLLVAEQTSLKMNVRTGVSNGENFVITPSIIANYRPIKSISIGGGIGARAFRPTYMATLTIRLTGQNNRTNYMASR